MFNASVRKAGDHSIMANEVGKPSEVVGVPFTTRFAGSKDLKGWRLLPEDRVFNKERYAACPSIRFLDGWHYMTYLETLPGPNYKTHPSWPATFRSCWGLAAACSRRRPRT